LIPLAHQRPRTALASRALFNARLDAALAAARFSGGELSVLAIALQPSREAGDRLLREAARRMLDALRRSDTVALVGGHQFWALLPATSAADAHGVAEKIRRALSGIDASIGAATCPEDGTEAGELNRFAHWAMYWDGRSARRPALQLIP